MVLNEDLPKSLAEFLSGMSEEELKRRREECKIKSKHKLPSIAESFNPINYVGLYSKNTVSMFCENCFEYYERPLNKREKKEIEDHIRWMHRYPIVMYC